MMMMQETKQQAKIAITKSFFIEQNSPPSPSGPPEFLSVTPSPIAAILASMAAFLSNIYASLYSRIVMPLFIPVKPSTLHRMWDVGWASNLLRRSLLF